MNIFFSSKPRHQIAVIRNGAGNWYANQIAHFRALGHTVIPQPGGWAAVYRY
jgi:hypothetical protein